jgi:hypothetical protein
MFVISNSDSFSTGRLTTKMSIQDPHPRPLSRWGEGRVRRISLIHENHEIYE